MKKTDISKYLTALLSFAFLMANCDVHEFPEIPETSPVIINLKYKVSHTDFTLWSHVYNGIEVSEIGVGETYNSVREYGKKRYIIRAYPTHNEHISKEHAYEYVFERDISDGYDCELTLDLAPGEYKLMIWSDKIENEGDTYFYNTSDFSGICIQGSHCGCNDYRDAFRGSYNLSIPADIIERKPVTIEIVMQRPLAKYEFVTTDLAEFLIKEQTRVDAQKNAQSNNGSLTTKVNMEDYRVVFYYVGFMPNTYNIFTDRPVDSSTGVLFNGKFSQLNNNEASVGFDYVFVNGTEAAVTVQVGIFDKHNTQLSLSEPIDIPLKRSYHTVMRGKFLTTKAVGGISIKPGYNGDHNLVFN